MKPAMISRCFAVSGTEVLGDDLLKQEAYKDSMFVGEGHLDATDLLPLGGTASLKLLYPSQHDVFSGFVVSTCFRPGVMS
jgi:hypothetical protein